MAGMVSEASGRFSSKSATPFGGGEEKASPSCSVPEASNLDLGNISLSYREARDTTKAGDDSQQTVDALPGPNTGILAAKSGGASPRPLCLEFEDSGYLSNDDDEILTQIAPTLEEKSRTAAEEDLDQTRSTPEKSGVTLQGADDESRQGTKRPRSASAPSKMIIKSLLSRMIEVSDLNDVEGLKRSIVAVLNPTMNISATTPPKKPRVLSANSGGNSCSLGDNGTSENNTVEKTRAPNPAPDLSNSPITTSDILDISLSSPASVRDISSPPMVMSEIIEIYSSPPSDSFDKAPELSIGMSEIAEIFSSPPSYGLDNKREASIEMSKIVEINSSPLSCPHGTAPKSSKRQSAASDEIPSKSEDVTSMKHIAPEKTLSVFKASWLIISVWVAVVMLFSELMSRV